jgi:hypothetical protein
MANPNLTTTQMAAELGISPLTSIVLTNEPSSTKAKKGDGQEDARTQQTMQTFLRSINMLSPKDGRPIVKFKSSPKRIERHLTPETCRGRELGIVLELQTERDVDRVCSFLLEKIIVQSYQADPAIAYKYLEESK